MISFGYTPADEEDADKWYRQEHLKEISSVSTWRRTERYELTFARQNRKPAQEKQIAEPPKFLTLHFFDGESLPDQELAKCSESEWTKKNMGSMKDMNVAASKKLGYFSKSDSKL